MSCIFLFIAAAIMMPIPGWALKVIDKQIVLEKLTDYPTCQSRDYTGDDCHDALLRWVEAHPEDAFAAGKATRKAMNAWGAIPFFNKAFEAKTGHCADEDLKLAVTSALDLPPNSNETIIADAKKIAFDLCYKELKLSLIENASPSAIGFVNVCKGLAAKGNLSGLKLKKCNSLN